MTATDEDPENVKFVVNDDGKNTCTFEVALERAGMSFIYLISKICDRNLNTYIIEHGKFHWFLLLICGGCLMSVITETLNIGFVIAMADCELNLSMNDKGLLNGAAFSGIVLSAHFWGFLSDIWGRRKVLLLCTFVACIFSIISSFSVNTWMLIATRFFVGLL